MISAISPVCLGTLISGRQLCELLHALMFMLTSDDSCGSHDKKTRSVMTCTTNLVPTLPLHVNITCIQVVPNLYATAPSALCILCRYSEAL